MTCHANVAARAVTAAGGAPHAVLRTCLDQLEPLPSGVNLGFVYGGEPMAPMADDIIRALRARTGVERWMGACGGGILGGPGGASEHGLAVLVMRLPEDGFRFLAAGSAAPNPLGVLLAHAEIGAAEPGALLAELARHGAATVVGGLTAAGRWPVQIANAVMAGGVACLGFGASVPVVAGVATAGSPLGPTHRVSSAVGADILALDGRPALEVMGEELGELFRHAGPRFAPRLWLAERSVGAGRAEAYRMRRVAAVDVATGALRVEGGRPGAEVRLMRPDPAGSLGRVRDLARDLRARLGHRLPTAGLYLASRHRGHGLFGPAVDEITVLREELGQLPLIGLITDAEIFDGVIHEASGVLVLIG